MADDLQPNSNESAARHVIAGVRGGERSDLIRALDLVLDDTTRSTGERYVAQAALALWNGGGDVTFAQLIRTLDDDNIRRVLEATWALRLKELVPAGQVVDGRFGPQFTVAERALIAATIESFLEITATLLESGIIETRVERREVLKELVARLQS